MHCYLARFCSYGLLLACIFSTYLCCDDTKLCSSAVLTFLQLSCILEFDGASKGNPGKAGAGVIIRRIDGSVVCSQLVAKLVFY